MRGRKSAAKSYVEPVAVGDVTGAGVVGEVLDSSFDGLNGGDLVVGLGGWQEYFTFPGASVRKIDLDRESASTALGVLGMPGMTAYVGLKNIGETTARRNRSGSGSVWRRGVSSWANFKDPGRAGCWHRGFCRKMPVCCRRTGIRRLH